MAENSFEAALVDYGNSWGLTAAISVQDRQWRNVAFIPRRNADPIDVAERLEALAAWIRSKAAID